MHALLLSLALLAPAQTPPEGVLPAGADGKPLNLDFETGTLKDWTADGDAFAGQPILGDTVFPRRSDMRSLHQGRYWIGGFEKLGDKPTGTLTSVPFKVTHPWATFLVGGGPHEKETCVEIVDVAKKDVIFRASGTESESLGKVAVDLTQFQGKEIQIRLVDKHTGHWGHLNFDDFRFHAEKPNVAPRAVTKADDYKFAGQAPQDAAKNMTVPPGFSVSLFAGEPDIHQPIAFCFDDRGRIWLVEAFTYPRRNPEKGPIIPGGKLGDRILILEDTDGDGKHDKKTVFMEGLNLVSGIEYGFGGLWVGAAPYFLFIPILEGDKAGEPKILLDGWGYQDTHETLNSFVWGPDGWLYGCHGVFTHSRVGKPGTPDEKRQPINAGVWRYHPTKHVFEVFAHGTSNPWGLDYNQYGDFFIEACVIPHLWHMVQGGRYERQGGQHFNPYTYDDIKTIAKHRHYVGATPHGGNNRSDSAGGGHAHSGLICYQGGTWPKEYHGKLFMGNIHGHRINVDVITPKGSGYEGDRNPDFLLSNDRYCIIVAIHTGPDGNVYFCDWSDKQVCHTNQTEIWDRTNGRLFKISHQNAKPVKNLDLQKLSNEELAKLQTSDNEWMVRHARRILQERAPQLTPAQKDELLAPLRDIQFKGDEDTKRLRALWAIHAVGGKPTDYTFAATDTKSPHLQAWGITLSLDVDKPDPIDVGQLWSLHARSAKSPIVLRAVASAIGRLPVEDETRSNAAKTLLKRIDETDPVLKLLTWYAAEPLVEREAAAMLKAAGDGKSRLLEYVARRVGAIGTPKAFETLVNSLGEAKSPVHQLAYLRGLQEGLKGKRTAEAPKGWDAVFATLVKSDSADVKSSALAVGVAFRDPAAASALLDIVTDASAAPVLRQNALATLLDVGHNRLGGVLKALVKEPAMRAAAIRGMARISDDGVPAAILAEYAKLSAAEKRDAVNTLAARANYAKELLNAIGAKTIPATDVPAEVIRQLRNLGDKSLDAQIASVWGVVRDTPADRKALIASWQRKLAAPQPEDLPLGRAVFARVCQQCHTLYGVGGKVGPDITGANRGDLTYILENMFDPSAVIPKEYAATKLDLEDGRVVTGIVKEETKQTLTVVTANETLTIPVADIAKRTPSELSMMPDDLTKQATDAEIRALVAYLRNPSQTPILATADNAKDFFNGKDLTGWDADKEVWSVEDGMIVGKTKEGLKRNNFVKSQMEVTDFKLSVKVKLTPNKENSGIQFRSVPIEGGEMRGPQADIGAGWWGKLYEESSRGLLVKEGLEKAVKVDDWNDYVVEAKGANVKVWINGQLSFDYTDEKLAKRGVIAFQAHSGGPMEVRFKDIKLEVPGEKK